MADRVEAKFESLLEAAPDAMVGVDQAGMIRFVNRQTEALFGYDRAELIGVPIETLVPEASRHVHPARREGYFADPRTRSMGAGLDLSGRRRDGTQFPVDISLSTIDTEDGLLVTAAVRDITERKKLEAKFESLLEAAPDAILSKTLEGIITAWNPAAERLYGYSAAEAVGAPISFLLPPGRVDDIAELLARVGRGERIEHHETTRICKDGRIVDVSLSVAPIRDSRGVLIGASTIARDITDRKRAEESARAAAERSEHALRMAEERFHAAFDDAPVGVVITDLTGKWLQVNTAFARLTGYSMAQLRQMTAVDLLSPDDMAGRSAYKAEVFNARESRDISNTIRHSDGHLVWVHGVTAPMYDEAGTQVGFISHIEDVTARRQMEEDLLSAERRYRSAFESAPVGMAQLDLDGRLVEVNEALGDLLGYTASRLRGRTTIELTHPDDVERTVDAIAQLAAGELTSFHAEQRYRHADGHPIWVALSIAAVTDSRAQVQHLLAHCLDITDRKRFEAELAHLADHDPLTGLLNRRGFEAELDRQAADVTRYGPSGALIMLDLDRFKEVNDTLGHLTGDELIVSIGEVLKRTVRATDIVARLGGDEFAIILPHALRADAQAVADKLVRAVRNQVTVLGGDHRRAVTASAGVAMFDDPGLSGEGVLLNADLAMYDAKSAGRNGYAFYNGVSPKHPPTKARLDWVERINVALEQDLFELHAQPVLDLRTGRVSRYELLLRMLDDDGAITGPDAFLHTAERTGLIGRIDRWVTGQAIDLLAHPDLPPDTVLEVNISGLSVGDADLLTFLEERFTESSADPSRLVFEITETAAVGNVQAARTFAKRLTDIGCQFALDDFGSGFGSFYYLKHLLFDYIKIDGEFIANCITSQTDQLVIQALVTIAHGMNKQTVAEFVGDEETLRFVASQGIDFAQGYHIGKPDVIDELIRGHGRGSSPDPVHT
ncbi:PAS domain S-box protein [Pengzhenrongella sp.]|uniref:PAS domain S-box protein n=1 Tax=Pengzhenrongella sp. TaxID=2888820 RepID=UPI002F9316ED